jgi:class 3 adenylate cyclase
MINRLNNLSIRNKLRLFTLGTCLILTAFFLASVWISTNQAVQKDVHGELNEAVQQFNAAGRSRLQENLQAGKDVADSPRTLQILTAGNKEELCVWGAELLGHSGLTPNHRIPGELLPGLDLVALVTPDGKQLGIVTHGKKPCEAMPANVTLPVPQNPGMSQITDWEAQDNVYELVLVPVLDKSGNAAGRLVIGFQIDTDLAERIVDHAGHEMELAGKRMEEEPMEVALWHMDGPGKPHILGLSGKDVPFSLINSELQKHYEMNGLQSVEFDAGGYSFISEPLGKRSEIFTNPEHIRITVIQSIGPKLEAFHRLELLMVFIAALAILLGFFAGSFFSRPIANPLVGLASAAETVAEGHLDRAHSMILNSKRGHATDEIGILERSFVRMVRGLKERLAMSTFLSQATYQHICSDALDGAGENVAVRTSLAVLFSDIRKFTNFSETESPEVVIALLNEVLSIQAKIVEHHGGDINKFIGDAVFAWFAGDDRCKRVIAAANEMVSALETRFEGRPGTQVGVGIHLGELVVGSVGSQDRKDYTAIGSVVNKAARLCSHAKEGQVLVSAEVAEELNDPSALNALEPIMLKGIAEPVHIFETIRVPESVS